MASGTSILNGVRTVHIRSKWPERQQIKQSRRAEFDTGDDECPWQPCIAYPSLQCQGKGDCGFLDNLWRIVNQKHEEMTSTYEIDPRQEMRIVISLPVKGKRFRI
jgi:hypothetical protein